MVLTRSRTGARVRKRKRYGELSSSDDNNTTTRPRKQRGGRKLGTASASKRTKRQTPATAADDDNDEVILPLVNASAKQSSMPRPPKAGKRRTPVRRAFNGRGRSLGSASCTTTTTTTTAAKKTTKTTKTKKKKVKGMDIQPGDYEAPRKRPLRRAMSQAVRQRLQRAKSQRFFVVATDIDRTSVPEGTFSISGSTGNLYTVRIGHLNTCSCPDFGKGHLCKHVLFVMLRVLKVDERSHLLYQAALVDTELFEIFNNVSISPHLQASTAVKIAYQRATSGTQAMDVDEILRSVDSPSGSVARRPLDGASCPICFESFTANDRPKTTYCRTSCGNNVHTACFSRWKKAQQQRGAALQCVFCRAAWSETQSEMVSDALNRSIDMKEGYVNLAKFDRQISRHRDTSTYYRRPAWRRYNRRRRWRDYSDDDDEPSSGGGSWG